jgi:hypothetical protein
VANLVAIAYDDLGQAQQVMGTVDELVREHSLTLDDAVVVERRPDGKIKLHQPSLAGRGAASGALWGGLIGLIFLMPLFGMAIGAASGAAAGALLLQVLQIEGPEQLGDLASTGVGDVVEVRPHRGHVRLGLAQLTGSRLGDG